jgi:hypothetical protein
MSTVTYQPNTDPNIERRVRQRYDKEMVALREFGFEPWFVLEELLFPFSLFLCVIIIPLMLAYRQVFRVKYPLRMVMYDQAVNHPSLGVIAFLGGLGVKFYTQFTDGGLLMSGITVPTAVETDTFWFYPAPRGTDLATAWRFHQDKVAVHLALGKQIQPIVTFEDFLKVEQHAATGISKSSLDTPENFQTATKATQYLYLAMALVGIVGLVFLSPMLLTFLAKEPLYGIGYAVVIILVIGNLGMTAWDIIKGRRDDLFFFPKTAHWTNRLSNLLMASFFVALILSSLKILPKDAHHPIAIIWFVYINGMSVYFRVKRLLTNGGKSPGA